MLPEPDGMAVLAARLAAEGAELVFTALTALAGPATAAAPRIEVRRADALVELACRALDDPERPGRWPPTGEWRRLVTDPLSGTLLEYGRSTYTPPAELAAFVIARDGSCGFPHCSRPAERCDPDHGVAWQAGGGTDRDNLGPLCRRHHRLKTHTGWQFRRNADASVTWTSPAGSIYTVPPPTVPPVG